MHHSLPTTLLQAQGLELVNLIVVSSYPARARRAPW